ncbi:MAG: glycosyltransferase family 4 protein [Bacillota bacterium]|jgi:glycosyltransferase involved in cell wall biosynthesis
MRVLMDRRAEFWYANTGMGTYSSMIWRYLQSRRPENCFLDGWGKQPEKNTDCFFWERLAAADSFLPAGCDLFFVPHNGIGRYDYENAGCPFAVTVHDVIPYVLPETVGRGYRKIFTEQMPEILYRAAHIIAVSHNTKNDLIRLGGVREEKISVIYEGKNEIFQPLPGDFVRGCLEKYYGLDLPYILYVGGFSGRKNVVSLLYAFSRLVKSSGALKLVLVGKPSPNREALEKTARSLGIGERIAWLADVPLWDLPLLYNGAAMLVYPSLYEGFGLPVLEAMACGTPVITGGNSSIPEVVGRAGILLDVGDREELAFAMELVLNSKTTSAAMSKRGIARAAGFTWEKTAEKTWKVFEKFAEFADKC